MLRELRAAPTSILGATEHRMTSAAEIRVVPGSNGRQFWSRALTYETVDDFGSVWTKGVFDETASERLPTLLFGHVWTDLAQVLGRGIDYEDSQEGPRALFELDDYDAVPYARQAAAQINSGTLRDMSVGFERRTWLPYEQLSEEDRKRGAKERMLTAGWDEQSFVIRGAVKGAEAITPVRSRYLTVPDLSRIRTAMTETDPALAVDATLVSDVAELLRTGAMDAEQARATLVAAARPVETPEETTLPLAPIEPSEVVPVPPGPPETPEAPRLEPGDPLEPVDPGPPVQPVELEPDDDTAEMALALATINTALVGRV